MVDQLALAFTTLAVVVCAWSLVVRLRRASGVERQQLRWVAVAAALLVVVAGAALVGLAVGATEAVTGRSVPGWPGCRWRWGCGPALSAVDLDRIISRTLAYGLLTLLLGGGYARWSWD